METPQGLRCHLCECRDYAASHPVPLPSNPDMLRDLASIGVPGAAEKLKLANKNDVPTLAAGTDTLRMDKLASRWDSQGKGHHICGKWVPNVTGSFRDAIDAFAEHPK
jgi:hypothetical protein